MGRGIVFKIALVFIAAVIIATVIFLLKPKSVPLVKEFNPGDDRWDLPQRLRGLRPNTYDGAERPLWSDRPYHTAMAVERLVGLQFVAAGRNEDKPYVLRVRAGTRLFTIANRADMKGLDGWTLTADSVFVDDVYPPRRFNVLLEREVRPSYLIVRSPIGGPSKPVFFDPAAVEVVE